MSEQHILIVDDNRYFREILRTMLERNQNQYQVDEAGNVEEACRILDQQNLDLVLLDARLGDQEDGLDVAEYVNTLPDPVPILGITSYEGVANVLHLIKAGVQGLLFKSSTGPQQLHEAVTTVIEGGSYFPEQVKKIMSENAHLLINLPAVRMTPKERALLRNLGRGLTAKDISSQFNVTVSSVETMRKRLQEKTNTHSTSELISYAYRNGLLP